MKEWALQRFGDSDKMQVEKNHRMLKVSEMETNLA